VVHPQSTASDRWKSQSGGDNPVGPTTTQLTSRTAHILTKYYSVPEEVPVLCCGGCSSPNHSQRPLKKSQFVCANPVLAGPAVPPPHYNKLLTHTATIFCEARESTMSRGPIGWQMQEDSGLKHTCTLHTHRHLNRLVPAVGGSGSQIHGGSIICHRPWLDAFLS
jgi:hypothetical protein